MAVQQQQINPQQQQQQWVPRFDKAQTRQLIKAYDDNPNAIPIEELRQHAQYHNVPFYEGDFSLFEAVKQIGGGFLEGFTTLNVVDPPDNEYEAVARSMGHLIGFAPGILSGPLGWIGRATKATSLITTAHALRGVKGIPLYAAEKFITPKARSIVGGVMKSSIGKRSSSVATAKNFLLGEQAKSVMEGAFNLGTASALSSWQHGVDSMIDSFFHGAVAGGVFRGIGNIIGKNVPGGKQFPLPVESQKAEKYARGLAGSLFMGLPSTIRGATTPEQIYDYMMGAYFGGSEKPWTIHKAGKIFSEKVIPATEKDVRIRQTMDAEITPGVKWETLEPEVKVELQRMAVEQTGGTPEQHRHMAYEIAEKMGVWEKLKDDPNVDKAVFQNYENFKNNLKGIKPTGKKTKLKVSKEGVPPEKDKEQIHIITGGEEGIPSWFSREAEKRGITSVQLTHPQQKKTFGKGLLTEQIPLTIEQLADANNALRKAADKLNVNIANFDEFSTEALKRDYLKAKHANTVFIFDRIANNLKSVEGYSKYASQMALDMAKPVFVFDKSLGKNGSWAKFNYKKGIFETIATTPELPQRYTIFSSKLGLEGKISSVDKAAIRDLFTKYDKMGFKDEYIKTMEGKADIDKNEIEMPDTAERIVTPLDNRMQYTFHRFLGKKIREGVDTNRELNERIFEHSQRAGELAEDILKLEERSLENKSEEWANTLETELKQIHGSDFEIPPEMRGEMRKWATIQKQGVPVRIVNWDGVRLEIPDSSFPYTFSGRKKLMIEPVKDIDVIYNEASGKETPKEGVHAVLESITKDGMDIELSRFVTNEVFNGGNFKDAQAEKSALIQGAIDNMRKQYNMHPYSGFGDKDRVMFVKYHPKYKEVDVKLSRKDFNLDKQFLGTGDMRFAEWEAMVKSNIAYDLALNNKDFKNLSAVMQEGYIDNAVAFNKRTQIWMTGGWRGDKEFIKKYGGEDLKLTLDGNFKGALIDDPKKVANILKANNIDIPESFDGAILATEKSVDILNRDAGHPVSGQNKSFMILRDPDNGTMLGKYMIHKVHPDMSKMMMEHTDSKGVNFLIMKSAIKQKGDRGLKSGSYDLTGDKLNLHGDAKNIIEIDPEAIRYSHSVFQDKSMFGLNESNRYVGIKVPKQLMTLPHANAFSKIKQDVIDDYYNELSQKSFEGLPEYNKIVESYLREIDPAVKEGYFESILENFENIGVEKVFDILRSPGQEKLAQELMLKILRTNQDAISTLSSAAELSGTSLDNEIRGLVDFNGTADKIIKNIAALKEDVYPLFFDKYTKNYIQKALDGYIADKVLNPRAPNSLMARMRPYDVFLQKKFPELNSDKVAQERWGKNADEIFFLGDLYKNLDLKTQIKGHKKTTLERLWNAYEGGRLKGPDKKLAEEVFEAISVRVPQDSMSGAQVLHFRGFTGIKDHGILQHGRVLRAEGGADLDGDESFVYFGGKSETGEGFGMKKSFKEMFGAQKDEYRTTDKLSKVTNVERGKFLSTLSGSKLARDVDRQTIGHIEDIRNIFKEEIDPDMKSGGKETFMIGRDYDVWEKGDTFNNEPTAYKVIYEPKHGIPGKNRFTAMKALSRLENALIDNTRFIIDKQIKLSRKGNLPNVKEMFKDELLLTKKELEERGIPSEIIDVMQGNDKTRPYAKYFPGVRLYSGEKAAEGRNLLAPIVSMTQNMRAAWSSVSKASGGAETIFNEKFGDIMFRQVRISKPSSERQRLLSSALTAFAADPMDMTGLKSISKLQEILNKAYFETKYQEFNKKKGDWVDMSSKRYNARKRALKGVKFNRLSFDSAYDKIKNFNSAFFGKNWGNDRMWTNAEKMSMIESIETFEDGQINTALSKFAQTLHGLDMNVSVFPRINEVAIKELYKTSKIEAGEASYLKDLLGRTYLKTPESDLVKFILTPNKVTTEGVYDKVVLESLAVNFKATDEFLKKEFPDKEGSGIKLNYSGKLDYKVMKDFLTEKVIEAERHFNDDLHDMVTLKLVNELVKSNKGVLKNKEIKDISETVEAHKSVSILNQIQRKNQSSGFGNETAAEKRTMFANRQMQLALTGMTLLKKPSRELRSKLLDMGQLDELINRYKDQLSAPGKKLYDYLMIGSLRHKDATQRLKKVFKIEKGLKDEFTKALKESIYQDGAKTSTTKLAYDSNAIAPKSLQDFFALKGSYFKKAMKEPTREDIEDMKKFEKESDEITDKKGVFGLDKNKVDTTGYEGLKPDKKNPLTSEQNKILAELEQNLQQIPDYLKYDLNELVSGIYADIDPVVTKDLNQMNVEDFKILNRWFKMNREGSAFQQIRRQIKEVNDKKVSGWDFMTMPEQTNKRMMSKDLAFLRVKKFFQDKDGLAQEKTVLLPTYYGDTLRNMIGRLHEVEDGYSNTLTNQLNNRISFLEQTPDAKAIFEMAMRYHELENKKDSKIYQKQWDDAKKEFDWPTLKEKNYIIDIEGKRDTYKGDALMKKTRDEYSEFMTKKRELLVGEKDENGDFILDKEYLEGYYDNNKLNAKYNWKLFLTKLEKAYQRGDNEHILSSLKIGVDGFRKINRSMMIDLLPPTEYILNYGKYKGKKISVDEYYSLPFAKRNLYKPGRSERADRYAKLEIKSTGFKKGYVPHYFLSETKHKESRDFELEQLEFSKGSLSANEYQSKQKQILMKYKNRAGDWDLADLEMMERMDNDLFGDTLLGMAKSAEVKEQYASNLENTNQTFNNMLVREHHTGGYGVGIENTHLYLRNLSRTAFRQLANMTSRYTLHQMKEHMNKKWVKGNKEEREDGRDLVRGWLNFWTLYAKRAMGMPTIISDKMYNDPSLKLNASPFGWWADNRFANWVNSAMNTLGIAEKLPESMKFKKGDKLDSKGMPIMEKMSSEEIKKVEALLGKNAFDAQRWSNLEAKFELATLMTHPKTPINNIFGGTMHTFQSVGYEPLRKARSLKEIQRIIPELTSWEKVMNFVESHGVLPEMTLHQFGMEKDFAGTRAKAFITDLANQATGLKEISKVDFQSLAKKYGISKALMNVAAKFMSVPERILRRDAFMAHYIKNWERLGGAIKNPNNPILIELAKKGVKATQFLYNAAERPAFAATGLGKVFSRFQLWSWNAVKFRNDVRKQGILYGFKPGTEAMRKFERTMQVDMFIMALGSVFMYSMFGQTIPAPYNWLQDTAEWIFGDEEERNRAFFGTYPGKLAPLQMITPPLARFPISVIREFAEDDYTKLADYYIWTMFPFGRMLRDVAHPEQSVLKNPMRIPEKVFGMPLTGFSKEAKRMREGKTPEVPTPGKSLY